MIVGNWICLYLRDRYKALAALVLLLVNASGYNGVQVTAQMMQTFEHFALANYIEGGFVEEDEGFPSLLSKNKKLTVDFCQFFQSIIKMGGDIIYDVFFMKNLTSILKHLSRLGQKNIRYTATLAGWSINTELAGLLEQAASDLNRWSELIQVEEAKETTRRDLSRLAFLQSEKNKLNKKYRELELCINSLYRHLIYKRIKDIAPVTRRVSIRELGRLLRKHPGLLHESTLRLFAFFLYDKAASVRASVLKALLPLYEDVKLANKLKLFSHKYQQRILRLSWDKSGCNQEIAIKLVTAVFR
ncbi:uncharacterized protein LOC113373285 [Ctenocephalides felis]|uniref:uncharacterized protein LOC113373285 n=1 Tax=Ctenocephalides felis TaxID=7515 RepID=UPI000E6E4197|nr:uncharacterized protein LOC113373285 [Ctenocephalides felis]